MSYGPAMLMGVGALACIALAVLCFRRFGSYRVNEFHTSLEDARRVASPPDAAQAPVPPHVAESR